MDTLRSDLRHAVRAMRKRPGAAFIIVLTLALAIGANTTVFSAVHAALLRPLPYAQPEHLVMLWEKRPAEGVMKNSVSPADYLDWARLSSSFSAMAAYTDASVDLTGEGQPDKIAAAGVSAPLFEVFGVRALHGRTFAVGEDGPGTNRVVVLAHALWRQRFGGDPSAPPVSRRSPASTAAAASSSKAASWDPTMDRREPTRGWSRPTTCRRSARGFEKVEASCRPTRKRQPWSRSSTRQWRDGTGPTRRRSEDECGSRIRNSGVKWSASLVTSSTGASRRRSIRRCTCRPINFAVGAMTFVLATNGDPLALVPIAQRHVTELDANLPLFQVRTMDQIAARSVERRQWTMLLLGCFAVLALLAAAGIYGVMAHLVSLRTPEIGVRLTLGARPMSVMRQVMGEGVTQTAIGLALGLGASFAVMQGMRAILFGIEPTDPLTLTSVAGALLAVAVVAVAAPAIRAMRVDPVTALRSE